MSELSTERESGAAGARDMELASTKLVLIGLRVHLFPSRTQKLSSGSSTIVCGRLHVKIDNANTNLQSKGWRFFVCFFK